MSRKAISFGIGIALTAFTIAVPIAQAASLTPVQVNAITSLLQSFGVDQGTIANVQSILSGTGGGGTGTTTPFMPHEGEGKPDRGPNPENHPSCPMPGRDIGPGARGEDVSKLQQLLNDDNGDAEDLPVTGFFGPKTHDALKHWQSMHGIASTTTPGFGFVGPRSRDFMRRLCGMGQGFGTTTASTSNNL